MAVRIKVRDAATETVLDMELEPDATIQEILKGAAGYWGKQPEGHVLRKGREVLRGSHTIIASHIADGDTLVFLTEAEAVRPVLVLEAGEGRSLTIGRATVLGRAQFEPLVTNPRDVARISSRHMSVWHEAGIIAIEDGAQGQASRNGTTLNGTNIRGRGRIPVRDGDVLGIAGVLRMTVRIVVGA